MSAAPRQADGRRMILHSADPSTAAWREFKHLSESCMSGSAIIAGRRAGDGRSEQMHSFAKLCRIGILAAAVATTAGAQPDANNAEGVAQQMLGRIEKAWSSGDAAAYTALFAPDAHVITRTGDRLNGSAEIRKFFTELWAGPMKGTHWSGRVDAARPLGAGYMLVESTTEARGYRTTPPRVVESSPGVLRSRSTMILARQGKDWRIVESQATGIAPPEPSAARAR